MSNAHVRRVVVTGFGAVTPLGNDAPETWRAALAGESGIDWIRAFDANVDLLPLILAYTTAYVVTSLPLPAGGAGGVEAGLAFSLKAVGVPLAPALLATLVYRFFTLWLPLGIAGLALTQVRKLNDELPRVEHEPAPEGAAI